MINLNRTASNKEFMSRRRLALSITAFSATTLHKSSWLSKLTRTEPSPARGIFSSSGGTNRYCSMTAPVYGGE